MKKHSNLSIFIPHEGCPNQCSFCDQRKISNNEEIPTIDYVYKLCDEFLPKENGENTQIAFFGGSFTAIDRDYMIALLEVVQPFIKNNRANSIRISTRPDCITDEILDLLKFYNVKDIELGAQSMQDEVLLLNKRGHTVKDVYTASEKIKSYGFRLTLQMMTGLYAQKDYEQSALDTARQFVKIKPYSVRIYPTITLKDTLLQELYEQKKYTPPSLEETINICSQLVDIFNKEDIKIIKLGLHAQEGVEKSYVAGPYHPAFKELVESRKFYNEIFKKLDDKTKKYTVFVKESNLSKAKGHKKENLEKFKNLGFDIEILKNDDINEEIKILVRT